ncbi:MAG: dockerin type I repeat-containing protein [Ruminococcus sp.]|nr:dockerin type I repeat-containing protein [Ruminococcus sp.]
MKKLISLVLALITLLSVATVMAGAAETDVADTSATYYVSSKPFENVADAKIIGYLGDLDADKEISILDATQVQLSLASLVSLNSTQKLLADVDRDGGTSIMDTTAIQCFIARIPTDAKVACTLFEKTSPEDTTVYEQIVSFMKNNASYSPQLGMYRHRKTNTNGVDYMTICYYENGGDITIEYHTGENGNEKSIELIIPNDNKRTTFNASIMMDGSEYCTAYGEIELLDADKKKVDFHPIIFNSELGISFESAKTSINSQLQFAFMYLKGVMTTDLKGNPYTLFEVKKSYNPKDEKFDAVVSYLKANTKYDTLYQCYTLTQDGEGVNSTHTITLTYTPETDEITILKKSNHTPTTLISTTYLRIQRDVDGCEFRFTYEYPDEYLYSAIGTAIKATASDFNLTLNCFSFDTNSGAFPDFADVENTVNISILSTLSDVEMMLGDYMVNGMFSEILIPSK